jgi:hypothetical protein
MINRPGGPGGEIADSAISTWHDISAALSPIIGQRGAMAVYKRSLALTRADYPWLAAAQEHSLHPDDFAALQQALALQTRPNAAAANGALLQRFTELLNNLIGPSLSERLLRSVWDNRLKSHDVQEMQ